MELKIGNLYRRRDGETVKIISKRNGAVFPFGADTLDTYTATGAYNDRGVDSPKDLVELLVERNPSSETTSVTLRTGNVVTFGSAKTAHKHAATIKAWADGATIEYKGPEMTEWKELLPAGDSLVQWRSNVEYRVKPEPNIVEFHGVVYKDTNTWTDKEKFVMEMGYGSQQVADSALKSDVSKMGISIKVDLDNCEIVEVSCRKK